MKRFKLAWAFPALLALGACASNVSRDTTVGVQGGGSGAPIASVAVIMTTEAQPAKDAKSYVDEAVLKSRVEQKLGERSLLNLKANQKMEILVTKARIRSTGAAVVMGFMAGADTLTATVTIKDGKGLPLKRFEVSASYAMGGLIAGQESMRLNWLYDKFADQTVRELVKS